MANESQTEIVTTDHDQSSPETSLSAIAIARIVLVVLFILLIAVGVGFLVYWLSGLILLVILAIFFAYLIAPLVEMIQGPFRQRKAERWMPRPLAIGIVYFFIFSALWAAIANLLPIINDQVAQFTQQLPTYTQTVRERFDDLNNRYQRLRLPPSVREEVEKSVSGMATTFSEYATSQTFDILLGSVTFLPWVILIPIIGFFILKDAELFRLAAVKAFPRGRWRGRAELFFQDVNKTLAAYTRAQLISCLLIGGICTAVFYLLGVRYALLLGLLAGILEFIPLVGPLIVGILATTLASFYSFNQAFAVAGFLLVLRLIHDYVTYPRIVREGIHLHPLAIILAILGGGELAGATGIFLAIPVVAIATVTYRHLLEHRGSRGIVAELLDEGKTDKAVEIAAKKLERLDAAAQEDLRNERKEDVKNEQAA